MSPEQIQQLVRMAEEIEALERSAIEEAEARSSIPFPAQLRAQAREPELLAAAAGADPLPFRAPRTRTGHRAWSWLAAAACMGVVVGVAWRATVPSSAPKAAKPQIVRANPEPSPVEAIATNQHETPSSAEPRIANVSHTEAASAPECEPAQNGIASMVFAIARDVESNCGDHQHVIQRFAPGPTGCMSRAELLRLGYEATGFTTPDRILVVSVSGPVEELPHTQSQAEALIACMDLSNSDPETAQIVGELGHDEAKYAAAARACLSDNVLVEAATLMGR